MFLKKFARCFRTIAIPFRHFLKTLEGDFKLQKKEKKLYLGDSQMVTFLTRKPPVCPQRPFFEQLYNSSLDMPDAGAFFLKNM